jgi:hypothetical protein
MSVVAGVQPQVVVAVIAGAPFSGGSGGEVAGVQPQVVVAVIAGAPSVRLPRQDGEGIANSNAMVTERYITCITVSCPELYGQVTGQAAAQPECVTISHDNPRIRRWWYRCVVGS